MVVAESAKINRRRCITIFYTNLGGKNYVAWISDSLHLNGAECDDMTIYNYFASTVSGQLKHKFWIYTNCLLLWNDDFPEERMLT